MSNIVSTVYSPLVSIIIPVYNGSDFLKEAIESALNQTYRNLEVIVVNDGSNDSDATENIALSYGNKIKYFFKENGGVASALNLGIKMMQGDYFSWLSHDDLYYSDKIEKQINCLPKISDNKCIVLSGYTVFNNFKTLNYVNLNLKYFKSPKYFLTLNNKVHGCTLLIPKIAFSECGLFNTDLLYTQDYDLWFRIADKFQFTYLNEILVKSRSHPKQGSRVYKLKSKQEEEIMYEKFILSLTSNDFPCDSEQSIIDCYLEIYKAMWIRKLNIPKKSALLLAKKSVTNKDFFIRKYFMIKIFFYEMPLSYLVFRFENFVNKRLSFGS